MRRRLYWAGGLYALCAAVSFFAVPWAARKALAAATGALPGFTVSAEGVSFNPLTLRLRLRGFSLRHAELGELASCREISAALAPLSPLRLALGLRELSLSEPRLSLVIAADGRSALDALPKAPEGSAPAPGPSFVPRVYIGAFTVTGGTLEFESRLPAAPQKVSARPIEFHLENLSTIPGDGGRYNLEARTNRGERLRWEGELSLRPIRLSGLIAAERLDLTRVSTAVPSSPVLIEAGRLDASTRYELAVDSGALRASLSEGRVAVGGMLWRLKAAPEPQARGPFALALGPAKLEAAASALGTPAAKVSLRGETPVQSGGELSLRAYATPKPPAGGAELEVTDLSLAPFSGLVPPPLQLAVDGGSLTVRGRAAFSPAGVDGEASLALARLALSEAGSGGALLRWELFAVDSAKVSTAKRTAEVAGVRLDSPFLKLARGKDGRTNAERAAGLALSTAAAGAPPAPEPAAPADAAPAPAWRVKLRRFALTGGRVLVRDDSVSPPFALSVTAARAEAAGLANDSRSTATFSASAKIDQAPFSLDGRIRLSTAAAWGGTRIQSAGIQLPLFSAYSAKFAGYKIDKGSFRFDLDHRIEGRRIATQNRAVIDQMEFGEKVESPDAVKAPVKLGLAVLKDRNGVIDLNVPVDGSLDDPEFHVWGAVLKTLGNLVIKAALSPFSALGSLMGSGKDIGAFAFAPGESALDEAAAGQLEQVSKFLQEKPQMLVGVRGAATRADALARGERELMRRLRGRQPGPEPLTAAEEARVMSLRREQLGAEASSPAQARADLSAHWRASDADLRALALARAAAIHDALAARGVPAERFFSLEPVSGGEAADEPSRLQLDMR